MVLLGKYLFWLLTFTISSNGCFRATLVKFRDIKNTVDVSVKFQEANELSIMYELKNAARDVGRSHHATETTVGVQEHNLHPPDRAIEYPLTRIPRSTPYLGRDWEQINPYGPAPPGPTTPMSPYNSNAFQPLQRKDQRLLKGSFVKQGMTDKLPRIFTQSGSPSGMSRSGETTKIIRDLTVAQGAVTESAKVSLKLTVLDAFAPTTIIKRPNVHRRWKDKVFKKRRLLDRKTRFRVVPPNRNQTLRLIGFNKYSNSGKKLSREFEENTPFKHKTKAATSRQAISIGLNVLPLAFNSTTIAADMVDSQPHAEPLKQDDDFWETADEDFSYSFLQLDEEMVCQIHRCGEYIGSLNLETEPELTGPSLAIDTEIDFHVGTNILKDIWNNHINADKMIGLEVVDELDDGNYDLEDPNFEDGNEATDLSEESYFPSSNITLPHGEFQSNDADTNEKNSAANVEELANESLLPSSTIGEFLLEDGSLSDIHAINLDASTVSAQGEISDADAHKFFTLPQNLAESGLSGQFFKENEQKTTDSVYVQNVISPEESITDFILPTSIDPVSTHLLPPSVLPAIHRDAVEGRVVQSGHKTRIVLRLKPTEAHPNGEVVVVPASKFDKFGTADIVLDSGRKISVKLKSENQGSPNVDSNSKPKSVSENQNIDFSYNFNGGNSDSNDATPQNIPLTILRDAVSGEPVMVMPGLTPSVHSLLRWQDLRSAENIPDISQTSHLPFQHQLQVPHTLNPNLNFASASNLVNPSMSHLNSQGQSINNLNFENFNANINAFTGTEEPSSIFGQNFATMTSRLQSGIRNLMDRVSGVTNRMEENVVGSFQNSVDFLRVFYENVLPENYSDDSMTMISIAAFLAFLGARFSDITSALGTSAVGRNALDEVERFLGKDISFHLEELFRVLKTSNTTEDTRDGNLGRSFGADDKHSVYHREQLITSPFHQPPSSETRSKSSGRNFSQNPHSKSHKLTDNWTSSKLPEKFPESFSKVSENWSDGATMDEEFYEELREAAAMWRQHLDKLSLSRPQSLPCVQRELCFLNTAGVRKGGFSAFITPIISVGVAAAHSSSRGALALLDALRPLWMAQSSTDSSACEALLCTE